MLLKHYEKRYKIIMQGKFPANRKNLMLASLMKEMESAFDIPMQRNEVWEQEHKEIFALYHKVGLSRKF